ncbi:MAG: arginine decarboxylase, pyruvoyl-dependent [Candidatus Pacearchaeota archaeon]
MLVPTKIFLTKGVGQSPERLKSFEAALRDAKIAPYNLVRVSSIFPPKCKLISREKGLEYLTKGQILHVVMSQNDTNEPSRLITASVGIAIPTNRSEIGYISEHHDYGKTAEQAGDYAEDLAAMMLAETLGISFDPNASYDERKKIWKIEKGIYRTTNITQSAIGSKKNLWTTVVAAAVLICSQK